MKAADLAVLIVFLVLAAGAAGAFYWWQGQEKQAAEVRYEAAVDELFDGRIRSVQLDFLAPQLAASSDRPAALQGLYADPARSDHLNLGFGTIQGEFASSYANLAEELGRDVERDRLQRELDERWGEGAFALMTTQYAAFIADAPRRRSEENAAMLQRCLNFARGSADLTRDCREGYARAQAAVPATP